MIVSTIIFISVRYNKYFILLIVFYLYPLLDQTLLIHFTNKYFDKLNNRSMILIQNLLAYTAYVFCFSISILNSEIFKTGSKGYAPCLSTRFNCLFESVNSS